jgi:hypothetical protein
MSINVEIEITSSKLPVIHEHGLQYCCAQEKLLTGQSGPPIRMATLETEKPSIPTTSRMALIKVEFIPTNCLTLT